MNILQHLERIVERFIDRRKCFLKATFGNLKYFLLGFIEKKLEVEMDRLTLRRFLKRYGLGCLREDTVKDAPLLSAAPPTEALSP